MDTGQKHHTTDPLITSFNKAARNLPEKYLALKKEIASGLNPNVLRKSWAEVLEALEKMTSESAKLGPEVRLSENLPLDWMS